MEEMRHNPEESFARRQEDKVTPREKIYPLRFIVDYILEKKNLLLTLEGKSLRQTLDIQSISEDILRQGKKLYGNPEEMNEEDQKMYRLLLKQQEMIHQLTIGLTNKGLAFEDMDNMIRQAQPIIMRLMFRDALTDTYNRYFFISHSDDLMEKAPKDVGFSLAFLDIDNFKQCNDVFGHEFGDEALKYLSNTVTRRLQRHNLEQTYFVRMGGDEFILISNELPFHDFLRLLDGIRQSIASGVVQWEDTRGNITVSIGAANSLSSGAETPWEIYRAADERLYEAKDRGKNQIASD